MLAAKHPGLRVEFDLTERLADPVAERLDAVFRCNDFDALRLAALQGFGIALLPDWVVGEDIRAGRLIHVLPQVSDAPRLQTGIHVLRALARPAAKLRTFVEALEAFIALPSDDIR